MVQTHATLAMCLLEDILTEHTSWVSINEHVLQAIQRLHDQYNVVEEVVSSLEVRPTASLVTLLHCMVGAHAPLVWQCGMGRLWQPAT